MADINQVVLVGRLTRDAELKYASTGTAIVKFSLALNRRKKSGDQWEDEANFFDITMMGRSAESVHRYLLKGKQVGVQGELRQNRWEQDGQPRSKVEVFCNNLQLLGGRGDGPAPASNSGGYSNANTNYPAPSVDDGFDDDVPF